MKLTVKKRMDSEMNLKALELIYRNSETDEEMHAALEFHGVSESVLFDLAAEHGWKGKPLSVKSIPQHDPLEEVDPEYIDSSNKSAIRRLHQILEHSITVFQNGIMRQLDDPAVVAVSIGYLESFIKMREKLTKLEMPLYGLTTSEPLAIANPFNLYFSDEKEDTQAVTVTAEKEITPEEPPSSEDLI